MSGTVTKVSGPLVMAAGLEDAGAGDMVSVGKRRLAGEILSLSGNGAVIRMFDPSDGLAFGEEVSDFGGPLAVELGPGLFGGVFDSLLRPLYGGGDQTAVLWDFVPSVSDGAQVTEGDVIGTVTEAGGFIHRIMLPAGLSGTVVSIQEGSYAAQDSVCLLRDGEGENHRLTLTQRWPVRKSRPFARKTLPSAPLHSGIRAVDTFFPLAKGGTALISGAAGSGKTVLLQSLAGCSDADVIVYVCCGGRGNEISTLRNALSEMKDENGVSLLGRTVVIADTDDMPPASREAAVYAGATVAEYCRDMGYSVILLVDTLSAWAEGLREISEKLGEAVCEDAYPAYLGSRISELFWRAGQVNCLGREGRRGELTIIGSVSTSSGDAQETVLKSARRCVKVHLSLTDSREYPSVDFVTSFSMYAESLRERLTGELGERFMSSRDTALSALQSESPDAVTRMTASALREGFIIQNAFEENDRSSSSARQTILLRLITDCGGICRAAVAEGADPEKIAAIRLGEKIEKLKYFTDAELVESAKRITENMRNRTDAILAGEAEV